MRIEAWFDGAIAPNNPGGHAAYGIVIKADGQTLISDSGYIGHGDGMTNNVAEAIGAIRVLEALPALLNSNPESTAVVYGDSRVVINQLPPKKKKQPTGKFVPFVRKAQSLLESLQARVSFRWIPREQNMECDELSKRPLIAHGISFRVQESCPRCGGRLIRKVGRRGPFIGCSRWPKCAFTKNANELNINEESNGENIEAEMKHAMDSDMSDCNAPDKLDRGNDAA